MLEVMLMKFGRTDRENKRIQTDKDKKKKRMCSDPLTEGPAKGMSKWKALGFSAVISLVGFTAVVAGTARCEEPYTVKPIPELSDSGVQDGSVDAGDASQLDADIKDVNVPDVQQLDARPDVEVPDSSVDASVIDAGPVDAEVDSGVQDAAVDGSAPVCNNVFNDTQSGIITVTQWISVGGYGLRYESNIDPTNLTIEVKCLDDQSIVLSGAQFTLNVQDSVPLGDKNLTVTINWMNANNATLDAAITDP